MNRRSSGILVATDGGGYGCVLLYIRQGSTSCVRHSATPSGHLSSLWKLGTQFGSCQGGRLRAMSGGLQRAHMSYRGSHTPAHSSTQTDIAAQV